MESVEVIFRIRNRIRSVFFESSNFFWNLKSNPVKSKQNHFRIQPIFFRIQKESFQNLPRIQKESFQNLCVFLESIFQNLADLFQNPKRISLESRRFFLESKKNHFGIWLGCFQNPVQFIRLWSFRTIVRLYCLIKSFFHNYSPSCK